MNYTGPGSGPPLVTVVETPEFIRQGKGLLTDAEREALIAYLAANPTAGVVIPGTGGVKEVALGPRGAAGSAGARESSTSFTAPGFRCFC